MSNLTTNTVACGICSTATNMLGTKRCDRCWELERRIEASPELSRKIVAGLAVIPEAHWMVGKTGEDLAKAAGFESVMDMLNCYRVLRDKQPDEPAAERDLDQAMKERDEAEEMADKLADAIADLTGCAIGEHSSGNCPWQNALYAAEEMGPINPAQMLNIVEHASQLEVDYSAEDDMEIIEGFDRLRELLRPWRAERLPETKVEK